MELELKKLAKKDHKKVIQYAIRGMHFNFYIDNKTLLNLYGKYFWYLEFLNATQVISVYAGKELAGVLIADMKQKEKVNKSFWKSLYVHIFEWIQKDFFGNSVGEYDKVNKEMLENYHAKSNLDGEIRFLVANPDLKIKGIGTLLLNELEKRERGKEIFLFTDDQCNYQFYDHRGFDKIDQRNIILNWGKKKMPLKCFLYYKKL